MTDIFCPKCQSHKFTMWINDYGNLVIGCYKCEFFKVIPNLRWCHTSHQIKYWDSASKEGDKPVLFLNEIIKLDKEGDDVFQSSGKAIK